MVTELLLEPNARISCHESTQGIARQGWNPVYCFQVGDVQAEYERMKSLGVEFTMEPTNMGMTTAAVFDDTCGNLIQIYQHD